MGEISTVTFTFSRYTDNTFINTFFNEFYPATAGLVLVAMDVEVGLIWDTGTTESQITWLHKYNIEEYQYNDSQINLVCSEFSDFEFFDLPYYEVQDEFDNGMSYFIDAPNNSLGKSIPIVYGRPTMPYVSVCPYPFVANFTPIVRVSDKKYLISSHETYNDSETRLFEEFPEF